ncbi:MAG TPA: molecular chaperone [Ruminococcus sp.]|nr:molecular chaperone [Ruminococcus sp.]
MAISTFQRREVKFLLSKEQFEALLPVVHEHMNPDAYCVDGKEYGIYNIYYDTPDNYLIRQSIEKPYYKEKLRLRSYYSPAAQDSSVFLEVKKKIGGIVTKRRVAMTLQEAETYIQTREKPHYERFIDRQVMKEMDVFLDFYDSIQPRQYISYQRAAFFGKDDPEFRLTFDRKITARRYDLTLAKESYGSQLILPDQRLMEIKVPGSLPLWMSQALSELEIRKLSFSKYGTAYTNFVREQIAQQDERKMIYA